MKTAKKVCQTMLSFILVCSMFFGTGITNVIADTIDPTAVQNNLDAVEIFVDEFELLDGYEQSITAKNTINSIKDQLTIIQNMINSGDLQGLDEKNNYLEAVKNILFNILDYNARLDSLMNNILGNLEKYYAALQDLASAEELSNDNGAIYGYIDYRIEVAESENKSEVADALRELYNLIGFAENVVNPGYEAMIGADYGEYDSIYETLYNEYLSMGLIIPEDMELSNDEILSVYTVLTDMFVDFSAVLPDVGFGEILSKIENIINNNNLKELIVNGLELDVKELSHTVYVGYELENLEVIATAEDSKATVSITKPDVLVVGDNAVSVKVVSLSGEVKEYNINVVKLAKNADQGDAEEPKTTVEETKEVEETITYVNNDTEEEVEETTTEKEDKEEYDEEIEEESGLNGFTILLIVGGIALIGFGIYMLFGDKDEEIPKVKETKKVEVVKQPEVKKQNKTNNNKNSNKSKKKNRK